MKEKLFVCNVNPITGMRSTRKLYASANAVYNEVEEEEENTNSNIDEDRFNKLMQRLSWRGAKKIKGYKFSGTIPEPKDVGYYSINSNF